MTTNTALLNAPNFDPTIPRSVLRVLCPACLASDYDVLRGYFTDRAETDAPCTTCARIAEYEAVMDRGAVEMRAALLSPKLSHTRSKRGFVFAYHRDETSPTGVRLAQSCEEGRYDALAAELRGTVFQGALSPLSPTEGMCR